MKNRNLIIKADIVWTGIGVVVVLGGILAKGFHW